jgi:hypothetical protein
MRVQRYLRKVSKFMTQLGAAMVKAVLTTFILGVVVVAIMHYMGVPVPSSDDLLRGVERLAHVLS